MKAGLYARPKLPREMKSSQCFLRCAASLFEDRSGFIRERANGRHGPALSLIGKLVDEIPCAPGSAGVSRDKRQMGEEDASALQCPPALTDKAAFQTGKRGLGVAALQQQQRSPRFGIPAKGVSLFVGGLGCF